MNEINYSNKFYLALKEFLNSDKVFENDSFRIPKVRDILVKDRFKNIFNENIVTLDSQNSTKHSNEHNSSVERMFYGDMSERPDLISKPLSCLNSVAMNSYKMKVLAIGCRTEAEIFSLVNAGFNLKNIVGIDLISYTPLIELGDVCDIKKASDIFDVVVCGWTLEFVTEMKKAVSEIKRVTKLGGLVAIGGMHQPASLSLNQYNIRKKHSDRKWYASVKNILRAFDITHEDCVFKSEIDDVDKDKRGDVVVIFKNRKD